MTKETLTCEHTKPHKWTRESTRGRKPRFCDKHKPVIALSVSTTGTTTLHCQVGNHAWEREAKRGRKPANCPKHAPVIAPIVPAERNSNGKEELVCENGNHTWERAPQRGRKPRFCPDHSATPPRSVGVVVVSGSENGDPAPKKRGRPKLHQTDEEREAAALAKSTLMVDRLEEGLKARGTHISQQTPYILYRKVSEKPSRVKGRAATVEWEFVENHTPLMRAQYLTKHEAQFLAGELRYERENKVVKNDEE